MNVISKITAAYEGLSKSHKTIARYVLENFDKAAYLNVEQLSQMSGVSEATVVRFSAELGFQKYQHFQKAVLDYAKSKLTNVQRMELAYGRLSGTDIFEKILNADIEKIRATLSSHNAGVFNSSLDIISKARRIYIIGLRSSAALSSFMGYYFNLIFDDVHVISSSAGDIFDHIHNITENDVMIGISFPRYSKRTINALHYAKQVGAPVIGITDGELSPISAIADFTLTASSDMESFVDSLVAPMSLVNAMIVALGARKKDEVSKTFEKLEHIWREYEVYENADGK
ncbi:MAG: MurR/RpiR family transcriptional regulator [Ruminococcaceae bacterium]|nr:MurR/RpiR family transcriptional regulator [Oscillospiraceae bacterium]